MESGRFQCGSRGCVASEGELFGGQSTQAFGTCRFCKGAGLGQVWRSLAPAHWVHAQGTLGSPLSASTSLPEIGGLVKELPEIIHKAAAYKNLTVPPVQVSAPPNDMVDHFSLPQGTRRDVVWPRFPAITRYQAGVEPGELKAHHLLRCETDQRQRWMAAGPTLLQGSDDRALC